MSFKSFKKKGKQSGQKGFAAAFKNAAKKGGKPVEKGNPFAEEEGGEDMPPKKPSKKFKLKA